VWYLSHVEPRFRYRHRVDRDLWHVVMHTSNGCLFCNLGKKRFCWVQTGLIGICGTRLRTQSTGAPAAINSPSLLCWKRMCPLSSWHCGVHIQSSIYRSDKCTAGAPLPKRGRVPRQCCWVLTLCMTHNARTQSRFVAFMTQALLLEEDVSLIMAAAWGSLLTSSRPADRHCNKRKLSGVNPNATGAYYSAPSFGGVAAAAAAAAAAATPPAAAFTPNLSHAQTGARTHTHTHTHPHPPPQVLKGPALAVSKQKPLPPPPPPSPHVVSHYKESLQGQQQQQQQQQPVFSKSDIKGEQLTEFATQDFGVRWRQ